MFGLPAAGINGSVMKACPTARPSGVPGLGPHRPQPRIHLVAGTTLQLPGHNLALCAVDQLTKQQLSLNPKVVRDVRCELRNESGDPVNGRVFSLIAPGLPENQISHLPDSVACRCVPDDGI